MLIKEFTIQFTTLFDDKKENYCVIFKDERYESFGIILIKNKCATFKLVDFNSNFEQEENTFRVPLTRSVFLFLRRYDEKGGIQRIESDDTMDQKIATIPFYSQREKKELISIKNVGLWPLFKYKLAICVSQDCHIESFLAKFKHVNAYNEKIDDYAYFNKVFFEIRKQFPNIFYKDDKDLRTGKNGDKWDMNIEVSSAGDCEDFAGFYMHVFHTLKLFWNFIHEKLLGLEKAPKNICEKYNAYFLLCKMENENHCRFALYSKENKKLLPFEATALKKIQNHKYKNFLLINSFSKINLLI